MKNVLGIYYTVKRLSSLQPTNKNLIISRDVEVHENASWNWEEEKVVKSNILV